MKYAVATLAIFATLFAVNKSFAATGNFAGASTSVEAAKAGFRLSIPSLKINLSVVNAPFRQATWDFSNIIGQAGHLEGLPMPGQRSNVVIGGHSELSQRRPGVFYHLAELEKGDAIVVNYGGHKYIYQVVSKREVSPLRTEVLSSTSNETLTLMTCSGYIRGQYTTRLVIQALLVYEH
jgi:LPXTG-site transpeptidase (sortase) family protein